MAITDRIIAYYSCENVNDAHTGGYHLTNVNTATFATGKVADGVDCDTTNQSGLVRANADAAAFQFGLSSRSVAFWVYPSTLPTSGNGASLVRMGASSAADLGFHVIYNNSAGTGQFVARMADGTTLYTANASGYAVGSWYHVAAVYDRNGFLRLYIDGVLRASVSIAAAAAVDISSDDDLRIGGLHQVYFDGIIDEVLIYDGVMSGDVRAVHRNGTTGNSYATLSAITRPFVSQEFVTITTGSNVVTAVTGVGDLVADQIVMVIQQVDGNSTVPTITAWDGAWTQIVDEVATQFGTPFTRQRIWWKTVTATDVSTETQVTTGWSSGQEFTQRVLLWDNCAGVLVDASSAGTTSTTSREAPSIDTTGTDGCTIMVVHGWDASATLSSFDSALSDGGVEGRNGSGSVVIWLGYEYQATGGATGTYPFTISANMSAIASTIAMEPAAGGAPDLDVSGAVTQGGQTFTGEVGVVVQASGTLTQGAAVLSGEAAVLVQINGGVTQGGATVAGTIGTPTLSVNGSITQGGAVLSGSVSALVQALGTLTQGGQVLAGSVGVVVQLSGGVTQGGQVLTGSLQDPNVSVRDIELTARPLVGIELSAAPLVQITLTAEPFVQ